MIKMTFAKSFRAFRGMTVRNMKVYSKDKIALLLSMLTQIIVLSLFLLFLKSNYIDMINNSLGEVKRRVRGFININIFCIIGILIMVTSIILYIHLNRIMNCVMR